MEVRPPADVAKSLVCIKKVCAIRVGITVELRPLTGPLLLLTVASVRQNQL